MTKNEIFNLIDSMKIREKDYDIIVYLMENLDERLFLKILEEVLLGNIYWSDFERYFEYIGYDNHFETIVSNQYDLHQLLSKLIALRNSFGLEHPSVNKLSIQANKEVSRDFRNDILYELSRKNPNDSLTTELFKVNMFNAIINARVSTELDMEPSTNNGILYINADDIMLTINDYVLPIDYNYIRLSDNDYVYMSNNNISEDMMKKIRAVSDYLKMLRGDQDDRYDG